MKSISSTVCSIFPSGTGTYLNSAACAVPVSAVAATAAAITVRFVGMVMAPERAPREGVADYLRREVKLPRSAGVQLHPTSLPGGRLGRRRLRLHRLAFRGGPVVVADAAAGPPDRYGSPYKALSAFAASPALLAEPRAPVSASERIDFRDRQAFWIEDWLTFRGGDLDDQVRFEREWHALRSYAADRGVRLIGDVPIYVAPRSADHLAHPELFRDGLQAGCPPDAFTADGQLWGNPIYDWPALQRRGYRWWSERMRRTLELFDLVRIDHFRGFVAYWGVPAGARIARGGRWLRGPGRAPFDAMRSALARDLPVIAEDLGVITPPVTRLRRTLGFPGMVVLQFAFDPSQPATPHHPSRHEQHAVAYTGTHDHDTLRGWWRSLPAAERAPPRARPRSTTRAGVGPHLHGVRLPSDARDDPGAGHPRPRQRGAHERPGHARRLMALAHALGALTPALASRLREATEHAGRCRPRDELRAEKEGGFDLRQVTRPQPELGDATSTSSRFPSDTDGSRLQLNPLPSMPPLT